MAYNFHIEKTSASRLSQTNFNDLPFGKTFSDHMFVADFVDGQWQDFKIVPYGNIEISPANMALHYGQAIFEGMKAHLNTEGEIQLFRPEAHAQRINRSAERLYMPTIPEDLFMQALETLVELDRDWIPSPEIGSLYIRPMMFATDGFLGVRASDTYRFIIMTGPTGPYYPKPVRLWVEEHYIRAFPGGTGAAKAAGNYAATIMPASLIRAKGFDQILWLDGLEYKYLQECGTMNIFVVIGDTLLTPPTTDSILSGITRDSLITLANDLGLKLEVRPVSIDEVVAAANNGTLREVFGSGTAAVISHVIDFSYKGTVYQVPPIEGRQIGPMLKAHFEAIKEGREADKHQWIHLVGTTQHSL